MTKAVELRELESDELGDRLAEARKELFNLRFQLATGRLDNISRIGQVRKEIARIITLEVERTSGNHEAVRGARGERTED
ncbi:MAG: rpmC [Acidimicrobiaceae bacterium]|jgi:large subunit ribosomal protein L29|nr:rpmC [Acidimicrobiaceae bacterium]